MDDAKAAANIPRNIARDAQPIAGALLGYYGARTVNTYLRSVINPDNRFLAWAGQTGAGIVTLLASVFVGKFASYYLPGGRDLDGKGRQTGMAAGLMAGVYIGAVQGILAPILEQAFPESRFAAMLAGGYGTTQDPGDWGGAYGAVPQQPMSEGADESMYGIDVEGLGTPYYEATVGEGSEYNAAYLEDAAAEDAAFYTM